jgi:HEAT repeat protein
MTLPTAQTSPRPPTPEALTEFILSLVQAFLRTGYYLPDHPRSKDAKVGLYQQFQSLFSGRHELTFIVKETGEVKDVLVDGALPDTQTLRSLMAQGMAEIYVPRLSNFFERKRLVSLTLKERMAEEEFSHFIDVMSEPSFVTLDSEAKELFVTRLREHRIMNISFVFTEDLVATDRKLPWRAQLALSRLRKDLKVIPLFQHLKGDELHDLRMQVVRDVLRPITKPDLMAVILLNSDLAHSQGLTDEEIENELVRYVPDDLLVDTARQTLALHLKAEGDGAGHDDKRAVAKLYLRLRASELAGVHELIREFFDEGLIDYETLPEGLKKQVSIERDTDRYLNERTEVLELFESVPSAALYQALAEYLLSVLGELIRRHLMEEVLGLLKTFRKHASLDGFRGEIATGLLRKIGTGTSGSKLKEMFSTGKKEDRVALVPIFHALGELAQPFLLDVIRETENTWVRKNACEVLLNMGAGTLDLLLEEMRSGHLSSQSITELLMVFEEFGSESPALVQTLQVYLQHSDARVRAEAAWALYRLRGDTEEDAILPLLDDPSFEVRKRAIRCLGHIKSEKALPRFMEIVRRAAQDEDLASLEPLVYHALADFPDASLEQGKDTEHFLVDLLKECYPRGLRAMIHFHDHPRLRPPAFWAICETLGTIGTTASIQVLTDIDKQLKGQGREKLEGVIQKIKARVETREPAGVT